MKQFTPKSLKSIQLSQRANVYYLEYCRILVHGGRVEYVTEEKKSVAYWNIPIANTTCLLLGTGTSITQAAMRELAKAGVAVGFCGGGGTPLFSAADREIPVVWLTPQSEYRPVEYVQQWFRLWSDPQRRLNAAKYFQKVRLERVLHCWTTNRFDAPFFEDAVTLRGVVAQANAQMQAAADGTALLLEEARLTKNLFRLAAQQCAYGSFTRRRAAQASDPANRFLDQGNYLAYGLAAAATWVLGLPHAFALLHGKTRRGALVFDVADLVKDATVLPQAFLSATRGDSNQQFRQQCIAALTETLSLDFMINTLQDTAALLGAEL